MDCPRPNSVTDSEHQSHRPADDQWLILVKGAINALRRPSSRVCIFKVPKILMDIRRKGYVPEIVSVGPYHHHCTPTGKLSEMEIHKVRAVHRMLSVGKNIHSVVEEILKLEDEIRDCYDQPIQCTGETLAWMLTLDGCFLSEIFRACVRPYVGDYFEPIFHGIRMDFTGVEILADIFKLENQIPLFVLKKLSEFEALQSTSDQFDSDLINLIVAGPMMKFYPFPDGLQIDYLHDQIESKRHILDLVSSLITESISLAGYESDISKASYLSVLVDYLQSALSRVHQGIFRPGQSSRPTAAATDDGQFSTFIPCAEELINAGIKFRACSKHMERIRFDRKKATIFLPTITIFDGTEMLFRNLMAFEACKASENNIISSYVFLMSSLVDNEKDVALLSKNGIIKNSMGSDTQVAQLFNGLVRQFTIRTTPEYQKLRKDVNRQYGSKMKGMLAEFRKQHCSRPWRILSLVAATLVLLMTAVQTIFSVNF